MDTSRTNFVDVPGTSDASFAFADPLHFWDDDESYDKGDKESPALGRSGLIEDKFLKAADDKKKATSALPTWGNVYRLGDLPDYFTAPQN